MVNQVVFVLGGPGSGKSTECRLLSLLNMVHIPAGDLLRSRMLVDDETGRMIRDIMTRGLLVPSSLSCGLVLDRIRSLIPCVNDTTIFLVDGFPRNIDNWLTWQKDSPYPVSAVVSLETDEPTMLTRTLGRSSGRIDDMEDTVRLRYESHIRDTLPVIDLLDTMGLVIRVDSSGTPDQVHQLVIEQLSKKIAHTQN